MASVNKAILVGNLGRDPEIKYMQNGEAVCNISIATTSKWKDKNTGENKEDTEWHRVVLYRRQAEIAGEYLKKGSSVYLEGKLRTRKWTGQDGKDNYTTEIVVDVLQMLDSKGEKSGGRQRYSQEAPSQAQQKNQSQGGGINMDDDIPFRSLSGSILYAI